MYPFNSTSMGVRFIAILGLIFSWVTVIGVVSANDSQATPAYSTPELIDQAFNNGVIDNQARLLYFAYAIYDQQSLPEMYKSKVGWHGTQHLHEVKQAYFNNPTIFSDSTFQKLKQLLEPSEESLKEPGSSASALTRQLCDRANEANHDSTTSPRFTFSFGTIGGQLTIANYIQSMDTSANVILGAYGWAEPPLCTQDGFGGCTTTTNDLGGPNGKYPVLISNLGNGLFGFVDVNTNSGQGYNGFVGDNPNTALAETDALASCIVLNSDLSPTNIEGSVTLTQQINNLNGTTSHEYVHAVQFAWGEPGNPFEAMWAESTAAYFEDEVFDAANSSFIYLYGDFNNAGLGPNGWPTQNFGTYRNLIMFRYIAEQCGGANAAGLGENVIQRFFENAAVGIANAYVDNEIQALKDAIENVPGSTTCRLAGNTGVMFRDLFHSWAIAAKFMKDCQSNPGYNSDYCLDEATEYQAFTENLFTENPPGPQTNVPAVRATVSSTTGTSFSALRNGYGIHWIRLPSTGTTTYRTTLTRTAGVGILRGTVVCDTGTSFILFPLGAVTGTPSSADNVNPAQCIDIVLVITNEQEAPAVGFTNYTVQLSNMTSIVSQPVGASLDIGDLYTLSVTASNASSFQWYRGVSGNTGNPVVGQTASTFTFSHTTSTSYWVRVTGASGSVDSTSVLVEVNDHVNDWNFHGTECITANLAQGQLFTWNKDGITNNFTIPLFVICPMSFDDDEVIALASPRFSVSVSAFLGPLAPINQGMSCFVRFFNATDTNMQADDTHVSVTTVGFTVGSKEFAIGDNENFTSGSLTANQDDLSTAHLLCLLPPGSTLRAYEIGFFE